MGCDSDSYWVKSDLVHTFKYNDWFNNRPAFPKVDEKMKEEEPCFDCVESFLFDIVEFCQLEMLRKNQDDGWLIFELTKNNVDILIEKTKECICMGLEYETKEEGESGCVSNIFGYWDDNIPERLCYLLRLLRHAKEKLNKHLDYSVVVNIYW